MKNLIFRSSLIVLAAAVAPACASSTPESVASAPAEAASMPAVSNIVETAMANGNFNTLLAALKTAGLDAVLSGKGPFTVFAPTDKAFEALGTDAVEDLLANKEKLTAVLTYHVVPGKVMANEVKDIDNAKTVNGAELTVDTADGVKIGDANVTQTDIETSNGVIHVIDKVLLPPM